MRGFECSRAMPPPPKVLYLSNTPVLGGTARILQYWLRQSSPDKRGSLLILRSGSDFISWARTHHVDVTISPMPWPNRREPISTLWHAARVAGQLSRRGIRLIHCNEHDIYPFAQLVRRLTRRPIVCHVRYQLSRPFAQWAFGGRRAPDALLWTSHRQRADSADAIHGLVPDERQHVLRLGVELSDIDRYAAAGAKLRRIWGVRDDEILVALPSPIRPRKRIEDFVEIIRRLAQRYPQIVGLVAGQEVPGDEEYASRIRQGISASYLGRRLRWVGYLSPVEPFHHACDISVSTSEYETFGNSVCEAMACGKAVAAYEGGSVAEVLGDTGLVVKTGDLDGLTAAVEQLAGNASLRTELGKKARDRVATEFNPANSFAQLQRIYAELLSERGVRR